MAFLVKYLVSILPSLLKGRVFTNPRIIKQMAGKDTIEFALFIGAFTGDYNDVLCTIRNYCNRSNRKSKWLDSFIAGSSAGLALVFDENSSRRQPIMLYLMVRALQFNGGYLMKKWAMKRRQDHPGETQWDDRLANFMSRYAGVAIMSLTSGQLIYPLLFHPDTLQNSYSSFLSEHVGFKTAFGNRYFSILEAYGPTVNQLNRNHSSITIPSVNTSRQYIAQHVSKELATNIPATHHHKFVTCALSHPLDTGCLIDKRILCQDEILKSLKVYAPLYLIMLVLFKSKQLITNPTKAIQKLVISTLTSSSFLTMYVVTALSTPCFLKKLTGRDQPWIYYVTGAVGVSMVFIETPGRQIENALYCLTRSFESLWGTALKKGYVKNVTHGEILLFMLSVGLIMRVYQNDQDAIGPTYVSIMNRLFGKN